MQGNLIIALGGHFHFHALYVDHYSDENQKNQFELLKHSAYIKVQHIDS